MRRLALLLLVLSACGPQEGIWLTVAAPFQVPTACDELDVSATRSPDGAPLFSQTYPLSAQDAFPLTLTLVTSDHADVGTGVSIAVSVEARLMGALVTQASNTVSLQSGQLVPLTVQLGP